MPTQKITPAPLTRPLRQTVYDLRLELMNRMAKDAEVTVADTDPQEV